MNRIRCATLGPTAVAAAALLALAGNKVPASQVDLSYQMVRIGGSWYIRNDNLDIGPDTGNGSSGSPVATAAP